MLASDSRCSYYIGKFRPVDLTSCYSPYSGWLSVGINSSITSYFAIAFVSQVCSHPAAKFRLSRACQYWMRKKYPKWFARYNYIIAAALDGGTQVMVFILSFAVQGQLRCCKVVFYELTAA